MSGIIVNEWLETHGGLEKVIDELATLFPDSPVLSLWNDAPQRFPLNRFSESWLAKTPLRRHKGLALPFMPSTWRHLGRGEADWILCSSHLFAHHARFSGPARAARKYVYAYTPARYIWNPEADSRGQNPFVRVASVPLQRLDRTRAQEATSVAAISNFVQRRIEDAWHRESKVIYPPVDVAAFSQTAYALTDDEEQVLAGLPETFLLGASRFIPYKRLDLVIEAGVASDMPVVLAGSGPSYDALRELASSHTKGLVTFVDRPSQGLLGALYRKALAYVFPAIEDFGIMPVEAMAAGTPVIGNAVGGVSETVVDSVSGVLLERFDRANLKAAVEKASSLDPADSVVQAQKFDRAVFGEKILAWVGH